MKLLKDLKVRYPRWHWLKLRGSLGLQGKSNKAATPILKVSITTKKRGGYSASCVYFNYQRVIIYLGFYELSRFECSEGEVISKIDRAIINYVRNACKFHPSKKVFARAVLRGILCK